MGSQVIHGHNNGVPFPSKHCGPKGSCNSVLSAAHVRIWCTRIALLTLTPTLVALRPLLLSFGLIVTGAKKLLEMCAIKGRGDGYTGRRYLSKTFSELTFVATVAIKIPGAVIFLETNDFLCNFCIFQKTTILCNHM